MLRLHVLIHSTNFLKSMISPTSPNTSSSAVPRSPFPKTLPRSPPSPLLLRLRRSQSRPMPRRFRACFLPRSPCQRQPRLPPLPLCRLSLQRMPLPPLRAYRACQAYQACLRSPHCPCSRQPPPARPARSRSPRPSRPRCGPRPS